MPSPFPLPQIETKALLQQLPKRAIASIGAVISFAVIGAINTASFVVNKTADLIAWAANDCREKSWLPLLTALCIFIFFARLLLMKLFQDQQPAQQTNGIFTPEQLQKAMESFAQAQHVEVPNKSLASEAKAFSSDSDFAKNLKRNGARGDLFAQPAFSSLPSARGSTRPPSPVDPDDALLNEAANAVFLKKNI